jgi:hypothetical protein
MNFELFWGKGSKRGRRSQTEFPHFLIPSLRKTSFLRKNPTNKMKSFLPLVVFGVLVFGVLGSVSADGKTGAAFGVDLNIIELADRLGFYSCLLALKETGLTEIVRTTCRSFT